MGSYDTEIGGGRSCCCHLENRGFAGAVGSYDTEIGVASSCF